MPDQSDPSLLHPMPSTSGDKAPIMLRLALYTQAMHVVVIALIVVASAILSASGKLNDQSTTSIFSVALGYAGGAASSRAGGRVSEQRAPE